MGTAIDEALCCCWTRESTRDDNLKGKFSPYTIYLKAKSAESNGLESTRGIVFFGQLCALKLRGTITKEDPQWMRNAKCKWRK